MGQASGGSGGSDGDPVTTAADAEIVTLSNDELALLRRAVDLTATARSSGNHPFGALLADATGAVVAEAQNTVETAHDPTAHAELNLIRQTGHLGPDALAGMTLFTSTEPCAMCAGGIYWAGARRVVFAMAESELLEMTGGDPRNPTLALPSRIVFGAGSRAVDVQGPCPLPSARKVHEGFWDRP